MQRSFGKNELEDIWIFDPMHIIVDGICFYKVLENLSHRDLSCKMTLHKTY